MPPVYRCWFHNEFQFLIVRLKSYKALRPFQVSWVSIPYSTIKIQINRTFDVGQRMFQFLIVRLKLEMKIERNKEFIVSIPYSTIKMRQHYRLVWICAVSIPYSTIKIKCADTFLDRLHMFQFLIVRLKLKKNLLVISSLPRFNSL